MAATSSSIVFILARWVLAGLGLMALVGAGLFGACLLDVAIYARRSDPGPADAALVLGAAVYTDRPSPVFEERIRHAVELYRTGAVRRLVMTGGKSPGDRVSEAEAARDWALRHGVPADAILLEAQSRTTQENLALAQPLLRGHKIGRVLVVSDPLHMRRAVGIARKLGIDAHPSPTPTSRFTGWGSWTAFLVAEAYHTSRCRLSARC